MPIIHDCWKSYREPWSHFSCVWRRDMTFAISRWPYPHIGYFLHYSYLLRICLAWFNASSVLPIFLVKLVSQPSEGPESWILFLSLLLLTHWTNTISVSAVGQMLLLGPKDTALLGVHARKACFPLSLNPIAVDACKAHWSWGSRGFLGTATGLVLAWLALTPYICLCFLLVGNFFF